MAEKKNIKKEVEKDLPFDEDLERCILGIIMLSAEDKYILNDIFDHLTENCFYQPRNRKIFQLLKYRFDNLLSCDAFSLNASLTEEERALTNGLAYFEQLCDTPLSISIYPQYIEDLVDIQRKREIITVAKKLKDSAINNDKTEDILSFAGNSIQEITEKSIKKDFSDLSKSADEVFNNIFEKYRNGGNDVGLLTHFPNLDEVTNNGFRAGQMIVLAARPGCGKTSFSLEIAANLLREDPEKVIAIFNMEMSHDEIVSKLISSCARVDSKNITRGTLSQQDIDKISAVKTTLKKAKVFIDDTPALTATEIHAKCRKLKYEQERIDFIIVDHMQLISPEKELRRASRYEIMTEISRCMKILAKDLKVPVMVLSQMSRNVEKTDDVTIAQKPPKMSDLRETGAIEQDADMVLFLTKGAFELPQKEADSSKEAISAVVAKNRSGVANQYLNFAWNKPTNEFVPLKTTTEEEATVNWARSAEEKKKAKKSVEEDSLQQIIIDDDLQEQDPPYQIDYDDDISDEDRKEVTESQMLEELRNNIE